MKSFLAFVSVIILFTFPSFVSAEAAYLGKESCAECHQTEFKSSEKSLESGKERRLPNSLEFLKAGVVKKRVAIYRTPEKQSVQEEIVAIDDEKDYSREPACLQCHATGFGKKGGYLLENPKSTVAGITCEACHGAGSEYLPYMEKASATGKYDHYEGVKRGVTNLHDDKEKVCLTCHKKNETCPVIAGIGDGYHFDYEKRAKIVHTMKPSGHVHQHHEHGHEDHHEHEHEHHHEDEE